jgi:hypothetical protein
VRRVFALASSFVGAGLFVACFPSSSGLTDGDDGTVIPGRDGSSSGGEDDVLVPIDVDSGDGGPPPRPISCKDAFDRNFKTSDGDVEIDPDAAGPIKPFVVHCRDMGTVTPKEYLTLVNTTDPSSGGAFASGNNVSGYYMVSGTGSTSCVCGDNTVRAFTKVRLKLLTPLRIDLTDRAFSSSNRASDQPSTCEAAKPGSCQAFGDGARFGVAGACMEGIQPSQYGRGSVDLRGTVFHLRATEQGLTAGFAASGNTTYLTDASGRRKQAEALGGGSCGIQYPGGSSTELVLEQD